MRGRERGREGGREGEVTKQPRNGNEFKIGKSRKQ